MSLRGLTLAIAFAALPSVGSAQPPASDFFERKIRPVLAEHCYSCHSVDAKKQRGGLLLDTKDAVLKGGDSRPALVPRKPKESLLLKALRYDDPELRMPLKGKLSDAVLAEIEKWIELGAPDPRVGGVKAAHNYPTLDEGRKFWAFVPPKDKTGTRTDFGDLVA